MDAATPDTDTPTDTPTANDTDTTVLSVTAKAQRRVLEIRSGEEDPTAIALWVEIMGASGDEFASGRHPLTRTTGGNTRHG